MQEMVKLPLILRLPHQEVEVLDVLAVLVEGVVVDVIRDAQMEMDVEALVQDTNVKMDALGVVVVELVSQVVMRVIVKELVG